MNSLVELIARKRDGGELTGEQIRRLIVAHGDGTLTDYQMSALCMAIYFVGMTPVETAALTDAMLHSGRVIDLSDVARPKVDKHSTGGVGDKVSLCLAPLVAACGVAVPMISGRGLGHTGGTLDKLEAIPGLSVAQDVPTFRRIVDEIGVCMIGQTAELAPADKRIYALRDVTATVEAIPLIVASILSKKLAEGIDALVLDVKVGRGAFMKTEPRARELAEALVAVGAAAGKRVSALLTDMESPLGRTIGNASEMAEALRVLHGEGPDDLVNCTVELGAEMLRLGGVVVDRAAGTEQIRRAIASGAGVEVMAKMVAAQGGDPACVVHPDRLVVGERVAEVRADRSGHVAGIDALEVGLTAVSLGAGRTRADMAVDHAVSIELEAKPGDEVGAGDVLATLRVRPGTAGLEAAAARLHAAYTLTDAPFTPGPLVLARIG